MPLLSIECCLNNGIPAPSDKHSIALATLNSNRGRAIIFESEAINKKDSSPQDGLSSVS